jgi:phosphoglycerate dehydrogenase-like enzyme
LDGQTLCVLGLGDIGGTLAYKAKALGMRALGVRRKGERFPGKVLTWSGGELEVNQKRRYDDEH